MRIPKKIDELEVWLENQTKQVQLVVGTRAAIRAFPFAMTTQSQGAEQEKLALLTARALIGSAVASLVPSHEIAGNLTNVLNSAAIPLSNAAQKSSAAARSAAFAAAYNARSIGSNHSANTVANSIAHAANAAPFEIDSWSHNNTYSAVFSDCSKSTEEIPTSAFSIFLWANSYSDDLIDHYNSQFLSKYPSSRTPWSFWRNWYEGFLNGEPLDWELQKQVASIPDDVWEAGVAAVAREIEGIQKPFDIRKQIKELKSELVRIEKPIAGIGHNNPPEAIETATPRQTTTIIWAELTALEKLSEEKPPDQEQLKKIGNQLKAISKRIGSFLNDSAYDYAKAGLTGYAGGVASTNWPWVKTQLLLISSSIDEWLAFLIL